MKWKRLLALALGLALLCSCTPKNSDPTPTPEVDPTPTAGAEVTPTPTPTDGPEQGEVTMRLAMLRDVTGLGMAYLIVKYPDGMPERPAGWVDPYTYTIKDAAEEVVAALKEGTVDAATLPTNLASVLYHETDGGVQLLSLNAYGGLYILEKGWDVYSVYDLAGKTLHAVGRGTDPEYILSYLCREAGIGPAEVTVKWHDTADQAVAATAEGELCMLPAVAANAALLEDDSLRQALDLALEWEYAGCDGTPITGCVVVRTEFARAHPEQVEQFLKDLEESVIHMTDPDHLDDAAGYGGWFMLAPSEEVAKAVLAEADLRCVTGEDMMDAIQGYYQTLYMVSPAAIGGSIPDGAFYYGEG